MLNTLECCQLCIALFYIFALEVPLRATFGNVVAIQTTINMLYTLLFYLVPYQQEILSLEVFSDDSRSLYLQWDLSHSPLADERFIIKFTIQSADNSVAITKVDLSCDVTCDRDKRVSYQLTEIVTNSNYFAEVTVMNLYGESTKIYQFYPQAIISELIGSVQCTDNSATIAIPLVIIIFLLILVDIIIIVIFVIWYFRYYRTDKAKFKRKTLMNPGREYVEMSPRDTTTEGYYNLVEEVREDPQFYAERNIASLDAVSEPTYAHIDEDGKVIEEGNKDRDYEVMQSDDPTRVTYSNVSAFCLYNYTLSITLFYYLSLAFLAFSLSSLVSLVLEALKLWLFFCREFSAVYIEPDLYCFSFLFLNS